MVDSKEIAAMLIQTAIIDALCNNDADISRAAREWLFLHKKPEGEEVIIPSENGFIHCCALLGISWYQLRKTLLSAEEIEEIPGRPRHLRLVQ